MGLAEFGDAWTEFYSTNSGLPIGRGYDRVVYGDHGPYVEFSAHQLCWPTFPAFMEKPEMSFFDEYYTADGATMLYAQKRTVVNKPNPPNGPWSAQNNRPEGYANYLIGKFYLACEPDIITVSRPSTKPRRKKRGKGAEANPFEDEGGDEGGEGVERVEGAEGVDDAPCFSASDTWPEDVWFQSRDWHWRKEDWEWQALGPWTENWFGDVQADHGAWPYAQVDAPVAHPDSHPNAHPEAHLDAHPDVHPDDHPDADT